MLTEDTLLKRIKGYAKKHGVNLTDIGREAVNNPALVTRLKAGKTITLDTANRVLDYLERPRNGK